MVDPLTAGLAGLFAGIVISPLLYVGYSSLFQAAEAINNDVDESDNE